MQLLLGFFEKPWFFCSFIHLSHWKPLFILFNLPSIKAHVPPEKNSISTAPAASLPYPSHPACPMATYAKPLPTASKPTKIRARNPTQAVKQTAKITAPISSIYHLEWRNPPRASSFAPTLTSTSLSRICWCSKLRDCQFLHSLGFCSLGCRLQASLKIFLRRMRLSSWCCARGLGLGRGRKALRRHWSCCRWRTFCKV